MTVGLQRPRGKAMLTKTPVYPFFAFTALGILLTLVALSYLDPELVSSLPL
jgi:hypothetical protein